MNFSRILNEVIHRRASSHLRNTCTVLANGWKGHASRTESRILRGDPKKNFRIVPDIINFRLVIPFNDIYINIYLYMGTINYIFHDIIISGDNW